MAYPYCTGVGVRAESCGAADANVRASRYEKEYTKAKKKGTTFAVTHFAGQAWMPPSAARTHAFGLGCASASLVG